MKRQHTGVACTPSRLTRFALSWHLGGWVWKSVQTGPLPIDIGVRALPWPSCTPWVASVIRNAFSPCSRGLKSTIKVAVAPRSLWSSSPESFLASSYLLVVSRLAWAALRFCLPLPTAIFPLCVSVPLCLQPLDLDPFWSNETSF